MQGIHRTMRGVTTIVAIAASLALSIPAQAANFCVSSRTQAQAALDAADNNGQADVIRFRSGVIDVLLALQFGTSAVGDNQTVTLTGGFNSDCSQRSGQTLLDGNSVSPILNLELRGNRAFVIDRLTFLRGRNTSTGAGIYAVLYDGSGSPTLRIDNSMIVSSASEGPSTSAAGLYLSGAGTFYLRNSLIVGNMAANSAAAYINLDGTGYIVGNTVTSNVASNIEGSAFRVNAITPETRVWLSNNIIWGNEAYFDLNMTGDSRIGLVRNDIGTRNSLPLLPGSSGNTSIDPQFANCGVFCLDRPLKRSSPLVDDGFDTPEGGMTLLDLLGSDRTVGTVDIGAYELERLFDDGFE